MNRFKTLICWLVLLVIAPTLVHAADVVTRRSSTTRLQGEVTDITPTEITIKPKSGSAVTVPANDIVTIDWSDSPATFKLARTDEAGGRLQKAYDAYAKLLTDGKASGDGLKTDIEFFLARTLAKQAQADATKADEALKKLEEFQKKHAQSFRFYESVELLGQLYLAKQDFEKAREAFSTLEKAPFEEYKMAAKIALARQNLLDEKVSEALAAFEEVSQMPAASAVETSRKHEARLGIAQCYQLQKEYDKAAELLDRIIQDADPEDSRVQAEAYVRKGDCMQAAGRPKDALFAYLPVDVLFSREKSLHAEALYHLSKLWNVLQQPERGTDAADRLAADYPNSPWTQKLKAPAVE